MEWAIEQSFYYKYRVVFSLVPLRKIQSLELVPPIIKFTEDSNISTKKVKVQVRRACQTLNCLLSYSKK